AAFASSDDGSTKTPRNERGFVKIRLGALAPYVSPSGSSSVIRSSRESPHHHVAAVKMASRHGTIACARSFGHTMTLSFTRSLRPPGLKRDGNRRNGPIVPESRAPVCRNLCRRRTLYARTPLGSTALQYMNFARLLTVFSGGRRVLFGTL